MSTENNNMKNDDWLPEIDFTYGSAQSSEKAENDDLLKDLSASLGAFVEEEIGPEVSPADTPAEELRTEEDLFDDEFQGTFISANAMSAEAGATEEEYGEDDFSEPAPSDAEDMSKKKKSHKLLFTLLGIGLAILLFLAWLGLTPSGRKFAIGCAVDSIQENSGKYVDDENFLTVTPDPMNSGTSITPVVAEDDGEKSPYADADYVKSYLLVGIEEIWGAKNTDTMMLVSVNTKDKTIKLTSFLRDTLVSIPDHKRNKLNAAYAIGGMDMLTEVISSTYDITIDGYAYANFEAFEKVIDLIGGVDIELGKKEAQYLNTTNYISKPEYRKVNAGWNHLNGNQALGYCRVRKVVTLGGFNNDYGRTVRQRRVITAAFNKVKDMGLLDIYNLLKEATGYIVTNIPNDEITELISTVYEEGISTVEEARLPYDGMFYDSGIKGIEGITYGLVIDGHEDEIKEKFHSFIFNDPENQPTPTPTTEAVPAQ